MVEAKKLLYHYGDCNNKTLVDMFNKSIEENREKLAVKCIKKEYTYFQLKEKVDCLKNHITTYISKNEECVGILLDRTCDYVVGIWSILLSGGAYVPMDVVYPEDRLAYMINECNINVIITNINYASKVKTLFNNYIEVEDYVILFNNCRANEEINIKSHNLAYVIYTSGSSGKPKGVMIEHKSVVNLVYELNKIIFKKYGNKKLSIGMVAPFIFDVSVQQIYTSLLLGHSLFITSNDERRDGRKLVDFINRNNIDIIDVTPTHLEMINIAIESNQRIIKRRIHFFSVGEPLYGSTVLRAMELIGESLFSITNMYGPTECCVQCTTYNVDNKHVSNTLNVPIGKPIGNSRIYILDNELNEVPIGSIGEIYVSGVGISRGYINNESLTKAVYLPDIFNNDGNMYKTGDLAMWREDGNIICLGRIDNQVKIRGYRVELGEIESQLKGVDYVDNAYVKLEELGKNRLLVAYIVSDKENVVDTIKEHLKSKLPEYMIPTEYILVDRIPINDNGKVDKKKLQAYFEEKSRIIEINDIEEIDEKGKKLLQIFKNILQRKHVKLDDSFFQLGGDSLLAFSLICEVSKVFNIEIQLSDLYQYNTVRLLANHLNFAAKKDSSIKRRIKHDIYPATVVQNHFLSLADKSLLYIYVKLKENMDYEKMKLSIKKHLDNQIIFKSKFVKRGRSYYQKLDDQYNYENHIEVTDCEYLNMKELIKEGIVLRKINDKLYYFIIYKNGFACISDHGVLDFYSFHILIKEIIYNYKGMEVNSLEKNYFHYALYQKEFLKSKEYQMYTSSLCNELKCIKEITTFNRSKNFDRTMQSHQICLKENELENIKSMVSTLKAGKSVIFLALFQIILSKLSGKEDIVIGIFNDGRNERDNYKIVGNFAFPIPLYSKINKKHKVIQYVDMLINKMANMLKYEVILIDDILNKIYDRENIIMDSLFNITYNYLNLTLSYDSKLDESIEYIEFDENNCLNYEINFIAMERKDSLEIEIQYDSNVIQKELIYRIESMLLSYIHHSEMLNVIRVEDELY